MNQEEREKKETKYVESRLRGWIALSPVLVFMLLYLVVSAIMGDFYVMPLSVALLVSSIWSVAMAGWIGSGEKGDRKSLTELIEIFSREGGNSNVIYMLWIFILAGAFATLAKETGAIDAMVSLTLRVIPDSMLVAGMFLAACLISMSIGTSVGTVVALVPLSVELANQAGINGALFVAAVLGGAFFGDNLSFISDTTIAATRTQGIELKEKFKANIRIVLPAAIVTLVLYLFVGAGGSHSVVVGDLNIPLVLPYLLIIVLALCGMNVALVLTCGILAAFLLALFYGHTPFEMAGYMGNGIVSMGELIIITLLASGMLGMVKWMGGIDFLLDTLTRHIHGKRGTEGVIALLVGLVNLCTANNTVAILTTGKLARDIGEKYDIPARRRASILDTASCIVQSMIPYGAQMLLATSLAGLRPEALMGYLYYPWILTVMLILGIIVKRK